MEPEQRESYLAGCVRIVEQARGAAAPLIRWPLDNDLVGELNLFICPVVVGQGTRLFPDTGRDTALELVESRVTPKGVTIQVYRPNGRPQYETADPTSASVLDIPRCPSTVHRRAKVT